MKNNLIVKEPEELVLMKGDFSESALKLSAYLIANLQKDKTLYQINIKDYSKKIDKKITNYNYLHNIAEELSNRQFKMEDRFTERLTIFNFVSSVDYFDGVLEIEFGQKLLSYLLEIKDKYLKYEIKNIISLNSKYSIRLYKILKDNLGQNTRFGKKSELKLSLDKIKEMLEIPISYPYGGTSGIKTRMFEKSKKEFEINTDIIFDYEEIKTGRKVTHIKFYIYPNPAKIEDETSKKFERIFKNRSAFVAFLRQNYAGTGKAFGYKTIEGKLWWLKIDKKGLLYGSPGAVTLDEIDNLDSLTKEFNSAESSELYDLWFKIGQNIDLYKDLIINGVCLYELQKENIELATQFNKEIGLLKAQGII